MRFCFSRSCAIIMVALCVFCSSGWCGTPGCGQCICVTDEICTAEGNCSNRAECVETEFTAACTQTYTLDVELVCSLKDGCETCLACAHLYTAAGKLVATLQAGCVQVQGAARTRVSLTSGTTYKLYAGLRVCAGTSGSECSDCVARARIYESSVECITPCN